MMYAKVNNEALKARSCVQDKGPNWYPEGRQAGSHKSKDTMSYLI